METVWLILAILVAFATYKSKTLETKLEGISFLILIDIINTIKQGI